jgi:hypothetical protein
MLYRLEMDKKVILQTIHEEKLGQYSCGMKYQHIHHQLLCLPLVYTFFVSFVGPEGFEPPCNQLRFLRIMSARRYRPI